MSLTTSKSELKPPHVALFPTAGMGHLIPFLRLAAMLDSRGCTVTFITVHPIVSTAESDHLTNFFTIYKNIKRLEFQLLPYQKSNFTNEDPFFIQIETIANSVHLLHPLLSSLSTPLSAIIADFAITTSITKLASDLSIPTYIVITTSARFFSVMVHLGNGIVGNNYIVIPGLGQMPISNIPPPMLNSNHYFAANISSNVSSLCKVKGVLINTFTTFEPEAIEAINIASHVPCLLPLGPFESFENGQTTSLPWLDQQETESVVFVSFGSRTALVFLPSGIGNLDLFFQLAVTMASSNCKVTFINIQPKASTPELTQFSGYVSNQREIDLLDIEIPSQTPSESTISDPFIINIENINNSLGQLKTILSSLSASTIFSDFVIAATMSQIVNDINIPLYIVSTTSALFFSTVAYLPVLIDEAPYALSHISGEIEIPGLEPIPKSRLPPTWMHNSPSNYLLEYYLLPNARSLKYFQLGHYNHMSLRKAIIFHG